MKHGNGVETHTETKVILRQGQWIRGTFASSISVNQVDSDHEAMQKEEKGQDNEHI